MRRMTRLVGVVVLAVMTTGTVPAGVAAQGARLGHAVGAGSHPVGRGDPRPLGPQPHLRAERGRPLPGAGLSRRQGPPVPVRSVAAPRHRHGRRDPRPARTESRHRHAAPHVPRRPRRRTEPLSPARQGHRRSLRARRERLRGRGDARSGVAARRVQDARHHARQVDAAGRDLASPGADVERAQRGHARARDWRAGQRGETSRAAARRGRRAAADARSR